MIIRFLKWARSNSSILTFFFLSLPLINHLVIFVKMEYVLGNDTTGFKVAGSKIGFSD